MPAPVFTATAASDSGSTSPRLPAYPAVSAGQVALCVVIAIDNTAIVFPGDWTSIGQVNSGAGLTMAAAWKRLDGSETGTISVTCGNVASAARIAVFTGCLDVISPIEDFGSTTGTGNNLTSGSTTTSYADRLGVRLYGQVTNESFSIPSGWVHRYLVQGGGSPPAACHTKNLPGAGVQGATVSATSTSDAWVVFDFAFKPLVTASLALAEEPDFTLRPEAPDTLAATATIGVTGNLSVTEDDDSIYSTEAVEIVGSLVKTEDDDILTSTATAQSRPQFFTQAQADALAGSTVRCGTLVEFSFATPIRLWNGNRKFISADDREWVGLGAVGQIDGLEETRSAESHAVTFSLSGVAQDILAKAIGETSDVQGKIVTVYLQLFDAAWQTVGLPIGIWFGVCQTIGVSRSEMDDTGGAQRVVSLTAENLFFGRSRPPAGRYTDRDQQTRFPGDRFMEFTPQLASLVYVWDY